MLRETPAKSSVITFRVPEELLEFVRQEASEQKTSLNAVMNQILTKHYEWDAFAQKYGFVQVPPEYYKDLLEATDERVLANRALDAGPQSRDYIRLRWKTANIDSMIQAFRDSAKYSGLGNMEMSKDESKYQLHIHHQFGKKHSLYVKNLLESVITLIAGSPPSSEMTDNSVIIEFQTPQAQFVADLRRRKNAKEPVNG